MRVSFAPLLVRCLAKSKRSWEWPRTNRTYSLLCLFVLVGSCNPIFAPARLGTPMADIETIVIDSDTELEQDTTEEMETESIYQVLPKSNLT